MKEETKKVDGRLMKKEGNEWVLACSDCKKVMPKYREAPSGFVSPESSEMRHASVMGKAGIEVLEKPVCLECYFEAFKRVYPDEKLPKLSSEVI